MSQILSCSEQGHEGQEITTLCLKKGCQHKSVLLCSLCKTGGHKEHQQYQIPLKQLSNPDSFPYWPREEEEVCNQAKDLVFEKYQANQDAKIDALFDTFQERLISELKATKEKVKSQIGSKGDFWTNLEQLFNSVFVIKQIRDKVELLKSGQLKTDAFAQQLSGLLDNQERSEKLDELRQECTHLTELSSLLTLPKLAELMASNMQSIFSAEGDTQPIIQNEEAVSEKQEQPKAKPDEGTSIQDVADLILQQKPEEAKLELDAESPDNIGLIKRLSRKSPSLRYDEIKVVFLGGKGVGKTSIINQFVNNIFGKDAQSTAKVEAQTMQYQFKDHFVLYQVYDTPATLLSPEEQCQQKTGEEAEPVLQAAGCFVLVYDVQSEQSFLEVDRMITNVFECHLKKSNIVEFPIVVVGNKSDLEPKVDPEQVVDRFQSHQNWKHLLCAAQNLAQVNTVFETVYETTQNAKKKQGGR